MSQDYEQYLHKEWLGLLQPEGLVVSPPALSDLQAFVDREKALALQPVLQGLIQQGMLLGKEQTWVPEFNEFAVLVLEWDVADFVGRAELPEDLAVRLLDYGETLVPDFGVKDPDSEGWLLLVQVVPLGYDLDKDNPEASEQGWKATYQQKFERLLKGMQVPIGLLWNGIQVRLVYAPSGESSGHLTFPIAAMTEVPGRSILGALEMLLGGDRLFNSPTDKTLLKLLETSRSYQASVSTKLAEQVLDALWELLRGFQASDTQKDGAQAGDLRQLAIDDPQHVYGGLLTTLMRLVFLLYAEDQGLMPDDAVYQGNYAVVGLYEKLREDASLYPDTMDQRYGAWAWLLSLFRLVYDGGGAYAAYLPARHGQLFDLDEYPFLEGRPEGSRFETFGVIEAPRIADGVIYRILAKLLVLNGERLSYRALDVEQIGSVYEAIMGFEVAIAVGQSIAVKPKDVVINLETLLAVKPKDRGAWLQEAGDLKLVGNAATALKNAATIADILAALERRVSERTGSVLRAGALYLQPGEERRRSGSHYTPRKLTQPIVETTLQPIFAQLGEHPTPEQILELKVCDLAMGSAAFLVEACRQLAERLVEAWEFHGMPGDVPDAVEPLLYARRLVAQRCLYGVDRNPFAVNLAKLSLWLVTLARDLPFTFVDHALKCGDSLVGLSRREIVQFGRDPIQDLPLMKYGQEQILAATVLRSQIQSVDTLSDGDADRKLMQWREAEAKLGLVRMQGDVAIAATFDGFGKNKKERELLVAEYSAVVRSQPERMVAIAGQLRGGEKPVVPFNWEVEFPEVFDRENGGFDAIVGNPPFLGGKKISTAYGNDYVSWLSEQYTESKGSPDLVAYFFRRSFDLSRKNGAFGLIATNTIAQGGTRAAGLRFICNNGGTIYNAQKRVKWPGLAAVVVSVINVFNGIFLETKFIDEQEVNLITAFLFSSGGNENPQKLKANDKRSFIGSYVLGMGFTFDDTNLDATPIEEMNRLIEQDKRSLEVIFPYIGGSEVNSSPTHAHHRYIINFGEMSKDEARKWPELMKILEEKVKPQRDEIVARGKQIHEYDFWKFWDKRTETYKAIEDLKRVLVIPCGATVHCAFAFLPAKMVFAHYLAVFADERNAFFCILQSRLHEAWAWFFGSSMKDDLRYTPSDCFETFPFPNHWETDPTLEAIGKTYYEYRAALMIRNNQGLTDTYNRFHDPQETNPEILHLRDLHHQIDRAVLTTYGWDTLATPCGFALDYLDLDETKLPPEAQTRIASGDLHFSTTDEAIGFDNLIQSTLKTRKKLPWRYRWSPDIHDEILARLLDLNQQRYDDETLRGKKEKGKQKRESKKQTKPKASKNAIPQADKQIGLIPEPIEQLDVWSTIDSDTP